MAPESGKTQGPKPTQLGKSGREDVDVFDIWQDFQTQKPTAIAQHRPGKRNRLGLAKVPGSVRRGCRAFLAYEASTWARNRPTVDGPAGVWGGARFGDGAVVESDKTEKMRKKNDKRLRGSFHAEGVQLLNPDARVAEKTRKEMVSSVRLGEALKAAGQLGLHTWKGVKLCQPFSCSVREYSKSLIGSLERRESCRQGEASACVANVVAGAAWNPIGGIERLGCVLAIEYPTWRCGVNVSREFSVVLVISVIVNARLS
ncbi:hypothetical protein CSOJ01_06052 [Colletotrichum sojae]|uniref:Uncharacterized protein n=1 Tax=Colletotrichum sojae TaxID=2175907 RepID=A0A8H6JD24_9PEZI|nr:hypothetical protein CSOJ01_06052 [Colletotrichum sojae]